MTPEHGQSEDAERVVCPRCGRPVVGTARPDEEPCSPLRSPDCWTERAKYDHGLRRWVLTREPTGPTA